MKTGRLVPGVCAVASGAAPAGPPCEIGWQPEIGVPGTSQVVRSMIVFDDGSGAALYVGGPFATAGGVTVNSIAKWDGAAFSALGSGVGGPTTTAAAVNGLAVHDDGSGPALYALGNLISAGGQPVGRIAKWDGSAWSALGSGLNQASQSAATFNDGTGNALYVGGAFSLAGGVPNTAGIARWKNAQWSEVGGGVAGSCNVLIVYDDGTGSALYAGGTFFAAGGVAGTSRVATPGEHRLARDIVNNGTLIWNNGGLVFEGATITNNADKIFFILAPSTAQSVSGENRIINHGEIRKQLSTDLGFGAVTLDNRGFLNVRNGSVTLDPAAVVQVQGTTLAGGAWSVYRTALLNLPGLAIDTIGSEASVTRIGRDAVIPALSGLSHNEGRITVIGGGALHFTPASGVFTNSGILDLRAGTHLSVVGDFVQTETGFLHIRIAGPFLLGSGRMIVADNAALAGQVVFDFGVFTPQAGQRFLFLTAESISGELSLPPGPIVPGLTATLVHLDHGVRLDLA